MASFSVSCPTSSSASLKASNLNTNPMQQSHHQCVSFPMNLKPALLAGSLRDRVDFVGFQGFNKKQSDLFKVNAQLNEVAVKKVANSALVLETKSEVLSCGENNEHDSKPAHQNRIADAASIEAFMTQVADLVELVDSRDVMELQLKQLDCEVIIRKKEAFQPPVAAPVIMMQRPPQSVFPSQLPPAPVSGPALSLPVSEPASPSAAKPAKSSHPPLKSPMAGTFYRCPAPGAPSFVKVGDKIQKGQVVCIIEAMKLMNEIESDQSGTLVEIVAEDGKPVSVDTPLFVIEP